MATQSDTATVGVSLTQIESSILLLDSHARLVWAVALLSYVGGDLVTTAVGLRYTPLAESGPLAAVLLAEAGFGGLLALKAWFVALMVILWASVPRPLSVSIPVGLALTGSAITLWNTLLITVVTG